MKKKNLQYLIILLLLLVVYVLMLAVLVISEQKSPFSQIDSFGDAFWFSLVTLSTVGYGDMTPKTPLGYTIGIIFLVMSMGMLVAIFGSVFSFLTSEGFPLMKLGFLRHRKWYYMADFTAESDALARDILHDDENAVIIYGVAKDEVVEKPDYPCMFINVSPARIASRKKNTGEKCSCFFLKENDIGKNLKAVDIHAVPVNVYACTTSGQERMSGNIHFFHAYDCCARSYWRSNPLKSSEDIIVLIGFDNYGKAILERAILTNINDTDFDVSYHVFGDSERFLQIHDHLDIPFGINKHRKGHDSIFFHDEAWTDARDIIAKADRIIICQDNIEIGWDDLWQLQRYYKNKGNIHLRSNRKAPGVSYFGTNDQIFTINQIVRAKINDAAVAMNDLYRQSVENSLEWDELSDQLKQSKIAAADHLFMKVRVLLKGHPVSEMDWMNCVAAYKVYCLAKEDPDVRDKFRRIEHARWVRFYSYYNWSYGHKRNDRQRINPMICDYEKLSDTQKAYHDKAWELIGEIPDILKKYS